MPMRCLLITVALATATLGPLNIAEAADVPGDQSTRATLPLSPSFSTFSFDIAGDKDWYRLTLTKGQDYHFGYSSIFTAAKITLRDRNGKALASGSVDQDPITATEGFSFRAAADGLHYLAMADVGLGEEVNTSYPAEYKLLVTRDCAGSNVTRCRLPLNKRTNGELTTGSDQDVFAADLRANRSYMLTLDPVYGGIYMDAQIEGSHRDLRVTSDDDNNELYTFRVTRSGRFLIRIAGTERQEPYRLLLRPL